MRLRQDCILDVCAHVRFLHISGCKSPVSECVWETRVPSMSVLNQSEFGELDWSGAARWVAQ